RDSREFVRMAVVDSDSLVWVAYAQGATGGLVYQPSQSVTTVPLYATANGKAWLATLPPDTAVQMVLKSGGFERADEYGPNVLRSIDALTRELKATAQRGYGLAINEAEPGVSALAVAIRSGDAGSAVGTVSVAGPSVRMTEQHLRDLAPRVVDVASELSELWPLRVRMDREVDQSNAGTEGKSGLTIDLSGLTAPEGEPRI